MSPYPAMRVILAAVWMLGMQAALAASPPSLQQTERGAVMETDRYRATVENGILASFFNKLTREEYLDQQADPDGFLPHLPSGLGTRSSPEASAGARQLYVMPWWELPSDMYLPNQHYPSAQSVFTFEAQDGAGCVLTYKGLTDGKQHFAEEIYRLQVAVDGPTGDLLLTPSATSDAAGVYGVNLTVQPIDPGVTIEAPIFDGIRITHDMNPQLWINMWGNYWDYAFLALNGRRTGAVGIWCQDAELQFYKHLFYLINGEGISFSLSTLNLPPFETLQEAQGMTWRFQAFDKSWAQAAARFRAWRQANVKIAPRPEWARHVSFVNMGVNGSRRWMDRMAQFLGAVGDKEKLARTVTFAATIRARAFDTAHFDNEPYQGFKDDMQAWKAAGARLMAYLQPMLMNPTPGNGPPPTPEQETIIAKAAAASTEYAFNPDPKYRWLTAQHNLGYTPWQDWMLDCVHAYIADYGADGVYHDQAYITPVDNRGLVDDRTVCQGMADYFRKAATRDPDSIHGTEHLTELNSVGASLGIASSVHWGTAKTMRMQRVRHASPIDNALHYPNATLFGFPHFVDDAAANERFNLGMELAERRGEIPGNNLQNERVFPPVPTDKWANDFRVRWLRATTFVNHGLRPIFPEDWDRTVRSYFQGIKGEQFRYEDTPWGSRFVRITAKGPALIYGRIHGVTEINTERMTANAPVENALLGAALVANGAELDAGISGWPMYNVDGPSGLDPDVYYVLDPLVKRPAVYFSGSLYEGCVEDGFISDQVACLRLKTVREKQSLTPGGQVILHAPTAPAKVWVDGKPATAVPAGDGKYAINFRGYPASIWVLLRQPPPWVDDLKTAASCRAVSDRNLDLFDAGWLNANLQVGRQKVGTNSLATVTTPAPAAEFDNQLHLALTAPAGSKSGTFKAHVLSPGALAEFSVNGMVQDIVKNRRDAGPLEVKLAEGESAVLSLVARGSLSVATEWVPDTAPANKP